jgi:hypothetical protein
MLVGPKREPQDWHELGATRHGDGAVVGAVGSERKNPGGVLPIRV